MNDARTTTDGRRTAARGGDQGEPRASNPNAGGPEGLRGGMGISSERTGPFGGTEAESADTGVQGTGSHGSAATDTEGTMDTERQHPDEPAEGRDDVGTPGADGPEMDDTQQRATQDWREGQPDVGSEGVDRTVGEDNPADVPSQHFDPADNPGHSHGP